MKLLVPLVVLFAGDPSQDSRLAIPSQPEQTRAERTIQDIFKEDYSKGSRFGQHELAKSFLRQGEGIKDDAALRFVFYREAADLAARAGIPRTALAAVDHLCREYQVDGGAAKHALLSKLEPNLDKAEDFRDACEAFVELIEEYRRSERFEEGLRAARQAERTALRTFDSPLQGYVKSQKAALARILEAFEQAREAEKVLAESPEDGPANLKRGEYLCLDRADWAKGLPFLSRGAGSPLKEWATRDLAQPKEAGDQVDLADGWRALAGKESSEVRAFHLNARAEAWYRLSLPGLSGPRKDVVQGRLTELEAKREPSPEGLVGRWCFETGDAGPLQDGSVKGNHGTLGGGAAGVEGLLGKGLGFDGKSSFASFGVAGIPAAEDPQTIAWAHKVGSSASRGASIIVLSDVVSRTNLTTGHRDGSVLVTKWGGVPLVSATVAQSDEWHHYAYTWDGTTHRLYVNGALKDQSADPCQKGAYTHLEIGRWRGHDGKGPSSFFSGSVDEVRIYSRVLSDGELRQLARRR